MSSIRKTKTASGATAVQVVCYKNRKVVVLKHIGSAHKPDETKALLESARIWVEKTTRQTLLFPTENPSSLSLATSQYTGSSHKFAHEVLLEISKQCGFNPTKKQLLFDLAFIRLFEPASKLRSLKLLKQHFDIHYAKRSVYRALPHFKGYKQELERIAVACATKILSQKLTLVLYDVTTLYFETFKGDDLRLPGFSKDNKPQQPQIVIGLLVTREGFPLSYEVFSGNTFEGKTIIPVLEKFVAKYQVTMPIVVADAGMLSQANVEELLKRDLSYIVGARLANCKAEIITRISKDMEKRNEATFRLSTNQGDLICSFSKVRWRKNKADMEKQIAKAEALVHRGEPGRRAKFVRHGNTGKNYTIDKKLIEKTKNLLGIRGYYTNVPKEQLSDKEIVARYYDLWHVEQAFRMAKNDLATRPIFHHKEDSIRAHMVICFLSLVLGKYLEIKTNLSLRKVVDELWSVTDARIVNTVTEEVLLLRSPLSEEVKNILKKLGLSY